MNSWQVNIPEKRNAHSYTFCLFLRLHCKLYDQRNHRAYNKIRAKFDLFVVSAPKKGFGKSRQLGEQKKTPIYSTETVISPRPRFIHTKPIYHADSVVTNQI